MDDEGLLPDGQLQGNSCLSFIYNPFSPGNESSPLEVISISTLPISSTFLLHVILSVFPLVSLSRGHARILIESVILFLPTIIGVTIFSPIVTFYSVLLPVSSIALLFKHRRVITTFQWTEVLLIPKKVKPTRVEPLEGTTRTLMITTLVAILAVDFPSFPGRFAKTESSGVSFMDVGVGSFVVLNGLIAPEARSPFSNHQFFKNKVWSSCLPLLVIGILRMVSIKLLNYHYSVSEYGIHWNFFVTLAVVKLLSTYIFPVLKTKNHPLKFSVIVLFLHQVILLIGGRTFILNDDRNNLFSANKEGIFSILGFIPLYITATEFGRHWHSNRRKGKSVDLLLIAIESAVAGIISCALSLAAHDLIDPISRRTTNASYISWIFGLSCLLISLESLFLLSVESMKSVGLLKDDTKSLLTNSLTSNLLLVFLMGNLLTGFVNLTLTTDKCSTTVSLAILIVYSTLISLGSFTLTVNGITLKSLIALTSSLIKK